MSVVCCGEWQCQHCAVATRSANAKKRRHVKTKHLHESMTTSSRRQLHDMCYSILYEHDDPPVLICWFHSFRSKLTTDGCVVDCGLVGFWIATRIWATTKTSQTLVCKCKVKSSEYGGSATRRIASTRAGTRRAGARTVSAEAQATTSHS